MLTDYCLFPNTRPLSWTESPHTKSLYLWTQRRSLAITKGSAHHRQPHLEHSFQFSLTLLQPVPHPAGLEVSCSSRVAAWGPAEPRPPGPPAAFLSWQGRGGGGRKPLPAGLPLASSALRAGWGVSGARSPSTSSQSTLNHTASAGLPGQPARRTAAATRSSHGLPIKRFPTTLCTRVSACWNLITDAPSQQPELGVHREPAVPPGGERAPA